MPRWTQTHLVVSVGSGHSGRDKIPQLSTLPITIKTTWSCSLHPTVVTKGGGGKSGLDLSLVNTRHNPFKTPSLQFHPLGLISNSLGCSELNRLSSSPEKGGTSSHTSALIPDGSEADTSSIHCPCSLHNPHWPREICVQSIQCLVRSQERVTSSRFHGPGLVIPPTRL